jgi:type VI secretion system Hcp family effector
MMNVRGIAWALTFMLSSILLMAAAPAGAAVNAYLKIDDAKGQIKATGQGKWAGWIPVDDAAYDASTPKDAASPQATGKRMHTPLTIRRTVDSASPALMRACASGQHFPTVEIDYVRGDEVIKKMVLTDVVLSSGGGQGEQIQFTFQKIELRNKLGGIMATDDWLQAR